MIHIREARLNDIAGIADVVSDVWEQGILADVCAAQIEDHFSALWVATDDASSEDVEEVLGLASAFWTVDEAPHAAKDRRRWEIDLVAVRNKSQGQGLGTKLINQVCEVGASKGASLTRALVRGENVASQRAFEKVGFTTDGQLQHLLLWTPRPGAVSLTSPEGVLLLPVDTVTYRGLWIEGLENVPANKQHAVVEAARAIVAKEGRLNTGALIPAAGEHLLAADLRNKARLHGAYTWYIKRGCETQDIGH